MKELNKRLSSGKLDKVYLFYGNEAYLLRHYEKRLREAALGDGPLSDANITGYESGDKTDDIIAALETPPFLGDRRLVVVKDSGLFQTGRKDDADKMTGYISQMPDGPVLLFVESVKAPDKRGKLYKKINDEGMAVEFATPGEAELAGWLTRIFKAGGLYMPPNTAKAMLRHIGSSMESLMELLYTEAQKLTAYMAGTGETTITAGHVEAICTQSVEGRIFGLVKEIGQKNVNALATFGNLITMKEQPLAVLSMITRQFRLMLICVSLREKGLTDKEIVARTGLRDFMVSDFLRQGMNFNETTLINAIIDCLEAETSVKTGKMGDRLAVEMLIVKYCALS